MHAREGREGKGWNHLLTGPTLEGEGREVVLATAVEKRGKPVSQLPLLLLLHVHCAVATEEERGWYSWKGRNSKQKRVNEL